eukprot:scaffold31189_cov58-Phaeocystis_antarctica.AAC.2
MESAASHKRIPAEVATGKRSAATTTLTTTHLPLWWRVVTRSTSTSRTQPATGCGGMSKCPALTAVLAAILINSWVSRATRRLASI